MQKNESYLVDTGKDKLGKENVWLAKVDLTKDKSGNCISFNAIGYDIIIECEEINTSNPSIKARKPNAIERESILRECHKNHGKFWSNKDIKILIGLFNSTSGDIENIANVLGRTEWATTKKLMNLGLIQN